MGKILCVNGYQREYHKCGFSLNMLLLLYDLDIKSENKEFQIRRMITRLSI